MSRWPPFLFLLLILSTGWHEADGHGRLVFPPSRSSMWRYGFDTPKNYNDMELFCGGLHRQQRNGGRCGVCGDPWDSGPPRDNERPGGRFATDTIAAIFRRGSQVNATVQLTANHNGYFEFKVCPVTDPELEVTQQCLDRFPLRQDGSSSSKYDLPTSKSGFFNVSLRLPKSLVCRQCVFQWTYTAGNNWGICEDGTGRIGCGPQETFRGCADITIVRGRRGKARTRRFKTTMEKGPATTTLPTEESTKEPTKEFTEESTTEESTKKSKEEPTQGRKCWGTGDWANDPKMDSWCMSTCLQAMPFCPKSYCTCS